MPRPTTLSSTLSRAVPDRFRRALRHIKAVLLRPQMLPAYPLALGTFEIKRLISMAHATEAMTASGTPGGGKVDSHVTLMADPALVLRDVDGRRGEVVPFAPRHHGLRRRRSR